MEKLNAAGVGVECRGRLVSALLYADDAVLFAEDEEGMRVSLGVLSEWCKRGQWKSMFTELPLYQPTWLSL